MIPAVRPGSDELAALLAEIGAGAAERERAVRPPHDAIDLIRRARLGALRVPVEQGGGGATMRELFETVIALAAADSNVAHILRTHFQFVEERLVAVGDDRWMDDVLAGAIFGNATTELGNQDVGGRTFATTLDGLVLTGTKYYCTGSLYSDFVPVLASTPEGDLVTVVVPADREGVTLEDDWDGIGQRLTGTGTVRLDGVRVEPGEVLGVRAVEAERAVRGPFLQLYLTAVMAGVVAAAARDAVDRARRRTRVFTHGSADTVAGDPLVQQVVGEMSSSAFAVEAIVLRRRRHRAAAASTGGVPDAAPRAAPREVPGGDRVPRDDASSRSAGRRRRSASTTSTATGATRGPSPRTTRRSTRHGRSATSRSTAPTSRPAGSSRGRRAGGAAPLIRRRPPQRRLPARASRTPGPWWRRCRAPSSAARTAGTPPRCR